MSYSLFPLRSLFLALRPLSNAPANPITFLFIDINLRHFPHVYAFFQLIVKENTGLRHTHVVKSRHAFPHPPRQQLLLHDY